MRIHRTYTYLILLFSFFYSCESTEVKLDKEAQAVFTSYQTCNKQADFQCLTSLMDSSSVSYYQTILNEVHNVETEEDLVAVAASMPFRGLSTVYTYFFYRAFEGGILDGPDLGEALKLLDQYDLFGHDFTLANYSPVDKYDDDKVWALALFKDAFKGNRSRRLEFSKESGGLKFGMAYRNSLANLRLKQGKYDSESIRFIINDKFEFDDKIGNKQFKALVAVLAP